MRKLIFILIIGLILTGCQSLDNQKLGASVLFPYQGGSGTGEVPDYGEVLVGQGDGTYSPQATSTLGIVVSGGSSIGTLGEIGDVSTSTLAVADILMWDGSNWINQATTTVVMSNEFSGLFDTDFSGKSTTNLSEGTNLYYTDARVATYINSSTTVPTVNDVNGLISTHAGINNAHQDLVTLSGTPDYITLSGQVLTRGTVDIGDDTNLAVSGTLLNLTGDTLSVNEGTLTDTFLCTYATASGLVCNTDPSSLGGGTGSNWVFGGDQTYITPSTTVGIIANSSSTITQLLSDRATSTQANVTGTLFLTDEGYFGDPLGSSHVVLNDSNGTNSDFTFQVAAGGYPTFAGFTSGGTLSTPTVSSAGTVNFSLVGYSYDGNSFENTSQILFGGDSKGTIGDGDVPGRLNFLTTTDGTTSLATRMSIDSAGLIENYGNASTTGYLTIGTSLGTTSLSGGDLFVGNNATTTNNLYASTFRTDEITGFFGVDCTNQFVRGIATNGTFTCATVDISSDTNLVAGTNITLSGDTLNVDDAFLVNNADDSTTGGLSMNSATTTDTLSVGGKASSTSYTINSLFDVGSDGNATTTRTVTTDGTNGLRIVPGATTTLEFF